MPVIDDEVNVTRTTLACDFCPATESHVAGTHAPLMEEYFTARQWTAYTPTDHDRHVVACPRCTPLVRLISREIEHALYQALRSTR